MDMKELRNETRDANHKQEPSSCEQENHDHNGNEDDEVTIIHFNDCYNVEPGPESSGAAGFLTAVNHYRHTNPMILFSGDILSPSFMSTFTKGEQMIPVLNDIGVHCAVFGNHEFDYGVDNLISFVKRTTFPWLLSNVIDKETSNQLGDGQVFHILERSGFKFGLIGLIEEEWLSTLSTLDSSDVIYQDFVERGNELAKWLKSEPHQVDYVIALTHFRTPNDMRLADSVPYIDLILGGHDHVYEVIERPHSHIIKSGTDFREFSFIKLKINHRYLEQKRQFGKVSDQEKPFQDLSVEHVNCKRYEPNEGLKQKLDKFVTSIDEKMGKVLGQFNCDLDGRFSSIRKFETNLGNFVTDIMLASTHADVAILNSGTLRSDRIHPRGDFTMRDLFNILGYIDPIAVLSASGYHIWKALENGVSHWPKHEGRFPQVSGCSFIFDPNKPPMQRIKYEDITIGDEPLDLKRQYKLTTKAYLASGKDGYDMLKECEVLVPGDESPDLTTSILNHFEAINIVKSNRRTHHRQSIICLSRSSLKKILDQESSVSNSVVPSGHHGLNPDTFSRIDEVVDGPTDSCPNQTNHRSLDSSQINSNDNNNNDPLLTQSTMSNVDVGNNNVSTFTDSTNNISDNDNVNFSTIGISSQSTPSFCGRTFEVRRTPSSEHAFETERSSSINLVTPVASSPLIGSQAPQPTLHNMIQGEQNSENVSGLISSPPSTIERKPRSKRLMSLYEMEHEQCKLEPRVEGRIRIVGFNA